MWPEIITIVIIVLIVGLALFYIIREKKKGRKCIGCPFSEQCSGKHKKQQHKSSCCNNHK